MINNNGNEDKISLIKKHFAQLKEKFIKQQEELKIEREKAILLKKKTLCKWRKNILNTILKGSNVHKHSIAFNRFSYTITEGTTTYNEHKGTPIEYGRTKNISTKILSFSAITKFSSLIKRFRKVLEKIPKRFQIFRTQNIDIQANTFFNIYKGKDKDYIDIDKYNHRQIINKCLFDDADDYIFLRKNIFKLKEELYLLICKEQYFSPRETHFMHTRIIAVASG